MNEAKQGLKGSPSRDSFKQIHKIKCSEEKFACDLDLVLVSKVPKAAINAFLDYKKFGDKVSFSEVLAYNNLISMAPLFIVRSADPDNGPFYIRKYLSGDWRPYPDPIVQLGEPIKLANWDEFNKWETSLRMAITLGGKT